MGGEPSDPDFENVTMLLHGDGTNGGQNNTFLDSSTNNFTITRNGNTTQGSFSPYGPNWSNYFDGTGDYLLAPSSSAWQFGTGDFTVEAWIFMPAVDAGFIAATGNNDSTGWNFAVKNSGNNLTFGRNNQASFITSSGAIPVSTWVHVAVTRASGTVRLFIGGVQNGSVADSTDFSAVSTLRIGSNQPIDGNWDFLGYMSNVRVVKGTALYTANFTPSTTPLTAVSGTSLLTCADNRFIDDSTNNFTITRNGDVSVQRFSPFSPPAEYSTATIGGSGYFDGSGDFVTAPYNAAFQFGTGDFTVEAWIYLNQTPGNPQVVCSNYRYQQTTSFIMQVNSSLQFVWYREFTGGGGGDVASSNTVSVRAWTHIAACRSSGTVRTFINGVQGASTSDSGSYKDIGEPFAIGAPSSGGSGQFGDFFNGYISNLRVVKGTALYTSGFTPPTAPITAVTNTSILTNFTNAAIFDNAMMNDLETVGNAQISTSVVKFGTGSISINSASAPSFLRSYNADAVNFGTGDLTIEGWIYPTQYTNDSLICKFIAGSNVFFLMINSGQLTIVTNGYSPGLGYSYFGALSLNTWTYIAVTRVSGTWFGYINGTKSGSSYSFATSITPTQVIVGEDATNRYIGNIDDFRITKGIARYTANFTPPTAAFPNK